MAVLRCQTLGFWANDWELSPLRLGLEQGLPAASSRIPSLLLSALGESCPKAHFMEERKSYPRSVALNRTSRTSYLLNRKVSWHLSRPNYDSSAKKICTCVSLGTRGLSLHPHLVWFSIFCNMDCKNLFFFFYFRSLRLAPFWWEIWNIFLFYLDHCRCKLSLVSLGSDFIARKPCHQFAKGKQALQLS